jgi:hypothetical protein
VGLNVNDAQKFRGEVRAYTFDGDLDDPLAVLDDKAHPAWDRLAEERISSNLVTNLGRQQMTKLIVAETTLIAAYMALSTDAITPAVADTVATITSRTITQALTIAQSYLSTYQRYVAYFTTTSFGSTGIVTEALLDASSTSATTNLWADASISVSKSTTQSLVVEHRIQATT